MCLSNTGYLRRVKVSVISQRVRKILACARAQKGEINDGNDNC
jgi:hypothetical protein